MTPSSARTRQVLASGWRIKQLEPGEYQVATVLNESPGAASGWLAAEMPAQIHDVLLSHGLIPDPHVGKNAAASAWVGEKDWAYACTFVTPSADGPVFLRCDGLDTLATVYVNGQPVGRAENMYRRYSFDVTAALRPAGEQNSLLVLFDSPLRYIAEAEKRNVDKLPAHKPLRKCHSDFGSYLGAAPNSVKVGIFDQVVLDAPGPAWLEDVCVRPSVSPDLRRADVTVIVDAAGDPATVRWLAAGPDGVVVAEGENESSDGPFTFSIECPALWWPNTHGPRNLYTLQVSLLVDGVARDARTVTFGVRRVEPVFTDPETGESRFAFRVNNVPIFMKGACWAPVEGMTHCWAPDRAERLLDLAVLGHMNCIRVWGEGLFPAQEFYDECDRRGILIWQDFMFGFGMHPTNNPAFAENCRLEVEDSIRRLRNHPCLALWSGGNENFMGWDFIFGTAPTVGQNLFGEIMPKACAKLDPGRLFHPSCPYGGRAPNWPLEGDWHDYTTVTFSPQASAPLFATEIGRASSPSVTSLRRYMSPDELWPQGYDARVRVPGKPAWPEMWQYRSVGGSWEKIGPIEEFCDPATPEELVRVLGTAHGEYLQRRVERERRGTPDGQPIRGSRRCWGNLIWRLNDSWPILYWSAVDYYLEPKIPYYFLRRAYAPVLVSFERSDDRICVWVVNDSTEPVSGCLRLFKRRFDGTVRGEVSAQAMVEPGGACRCLDATPLGPVNLRWEFLEARFNDQRATLLLQGERYLILPTPTLMAKRVPGGIEVSTDVFARQVTLETPGVSGAVFEDNFFDLIPGETRVVPIVDAAGARRVTVSAVNATPIPIEL